MGLGVVGRFFPHQELEAGWIFNRLHFQRHIAASIVGGDDDQRLVGDPRALDRFDDLPHDPVGFHDKVAIRAQGTFPLEWLGGHDRRVRAVQRHVNEERLPALGLLSDRCNRALGQRRQNIDGLEIGMCGSLAGGVEGFLRRALADEAVVLDPDIWRHVERGGDAPILDEAHRGWPILDLTFPVRIFSFFVNLFSVGRGEIHPEVPLADGDRGVAVFLEHRGDRLAAGLNQAFRKSKDHTSFQAAPPIVAASEDAVARGRAHRGRAVGIGEFHALFRQPVHVRRVDLAAVAAVGLHIPQPPVVGEDVNDVRFLAGGRHGRSSRRKERGQGN